MEKGKQLYQEMLSKGVKRDIHTEASLIDMYGKCGYDGDAMAVFRNIPKLGLRPDIVIWGAIIGALSMSGKGKESLQIFEEMTNQVEPNDIIMFNVLSGCSHAGLVQEALKLFSSFQNGELLQLLRITTAL